MPRLFVSTVGTSLLTAVARDNGPEVSRLLRETANLREIELDCGKKEAIEDLASKAESLLLESSVEEARRLSAELNGILRYYGSGLRDRLNSQDIHFLDSTDAFQGQITSKIVEQYLRSLGWRDVRVFRPPGLSTRDSRSFTSGVKAIVKWCKEEVCEYGRHGYHIIFNLVGGFKSLQGIMNTLGMFYADEIFYIFEAETADLIRIPRLPISMNTESILQEKARVFLLYGAWLHRHQG